MIVVAVLHTDIHPRLSHPPRDLAELTRLTLTQSLDDHIVLLNDANARSVERFACCSGVTEKEVRDADAFDDEHPTALDAHSCTAERLAHFRERAGPIIELDAEIFHSFARRA